MVTSTPTAVQVPRIGADGLKAWMEAGSPVTVLDARAAKAWDSSDRKIRGAIRLQADHQQIDPAWPKDRQTVAY